MKITPIRSAVERPYPNEKVIATPTRKGIPALRKTNGKAVFSISRKLENFVSRPAINIRKTRPTCPRNSMVVLGSKTPRPLGPTIIPPTMRAITHGRCNRENISEKNTPTKRIMKNGKSSIIIFLL